MELMSLQFSADASTGNGGATMKKTNKDIFIEKIFPVLEGGEYEKAASMWCKRQQDVEFCSAGCPYGDGAEVVRCSMCLEGRVRTLSLTCHADAPEGCNYRHAAKLSQTWIR